MIKLICDFSFLSHYVENFFSDDARESAQIVDKSVGRYLDGEKVLIIPSDVVDKLNQVYASRYLVLATVYDVSEITNIKGDNDIDTLIKISALLRIKDSNTAVVSDDEYVKRKIKEHNHDTKVVSIKEALELLK